MGLAVFTLKVSGGCPATPGFSGLETSRLLLAANCISSQHGTEHLNLATGWELQVANAMHEGSHSTPRFGCETFARPPPAAGGDGVRVEALTFTTLKIKVEKIVWRVHIGFAPVFPVTSIFN